MLQDWPPDLSWSFSLAHRRSGRGYPECSFLGTGAALRHERRCGCLASVTHRHGRAQFTRTVPVWRRQRLRGRKPHISHRPVTARCVTACCVTARCATLSARDPSEPPSVQSRSPRLSTALTSVTCERHALGRPAPRLWWRPCADSPQLGRCRLTVSVWHGSGLRPLNVCARDPVRVIGSAVAVWYPSCGSADLSYMSSCCKETGREAGTEAQQEMSRQRHLLTVPASSPGSSVSVRCPE